MKAFTLTLTLILTLVGAARAAPDSASAVRNLTAAEEKLIKVQGDLDFADNQILRLSGMLADKDAAYAKLKADDAKVLAQHDSDHATEKQGLQQQITDRDNKQNKAIGLLGQLVGGAVVLVGGVFIAFGEREGGFKLAALGIGLVCLSQAFSRWGPLFAGIGAALAIAIMLYETFANRAAGGEIADGFRQAAIAGKANWDDLWQHVDQATFARAKRIIKKVTT